MKWGRSEDGYVDSHCERYNIIPNYWGRCSPSSYQLHHCGQYLGTYDTQREAKDRAAEHEQQHGSLDCVDDQ